MKKVQIFYIICTTLGEQIELILKPHNFFIKKDCKKTQELRWVGWIYSF